MILFQFIYSIGYNGLIRVIQEWFSTIKIAALKYLLACVGKVDKPYVRFENGLLNLRAKDCLYKAAVSISAESSIIFGFDARYMLDALTQFEKQDLVTMRLTSPLGAISLIAGNSSAIVLPVRLKEEQKAA